MKRFLPKSAFIVTSLYLSLVCGKIYGQGVMAPAPMQQYGAPGAWMPAHDPSNGIGVPDAMKNQEHAARKLNNMPNYKTFTVAKKNLSAEAVAANAGYERHPDFGLVYPGAPCSNCYELIGERTETTKTFVVEGTTDGKKQKMEQTSTQPMHYKDANGNWVTIRTQLAPDPNKKGVYSITDEATPVVINTNTDNNFSSLGKEGDDIKFNRNLELIYVQPDGKEVSLGIANYSHHTAGDGGVYVTDAWPGIDIEMNILRGAIKTNFHINHALPQYADGKLLIRDHLLFSKGLSFSKYDKGDETGALFINDNSGARYSIGAAVAYEQNDHKNTIKPLDYTVGENNILDIALPGSYLNKPAQSYPVIIDPLVSVATSVTVNGSTYLTALTATSGCPYLNAANTPANCTITDIQFAFQYTAVAPCWSEYGGSFFYKGTCRSPGTLAAGYVWTCGPPGGAAPGTCTATGGTTYSIWGTAGATTSGLGPCVPAPQCASYPLDITMYLYSSYLPTAACVSTYIYGSQPLVITVIGYTVQFVSATATPATICAGSSTSLTGTGEYGVPPYTFTWTPGPVTGSPVTVSPTTTTVYTLTITDACGITATGNVTVTVNTEDPITGTLSLCIGNTTTLADGSTTGAHTWTSSTPAVATITSPGGVVTALTAGTTTITYTSTTTGCYATAIVTVTPLPSAILGTTTLCVGSTTSLSDATPGGTWSSSNTTVATISTTGIVSGLTVGTSIITYGSATCYSTTIVTVNLLAPITGVETICVGSTSLLSDAVGGGTWSSTNTGVATVSSTGLVTSISTGTTVISYVLPSGCNTGVVFSVVTDAPITGTPVVCVGATTTLNNATTGGGTWSSGTPAVAIIGSATGVVSGIAMGTSVITFTSTVGCTTTITVTVNPLPSAINGTISVCAGLTTSLSDVTPGGAWSSSNTGVAGVSGAGVVTGVSAGVAVITYKLPTGCFSTTVVTVNPLPAAISGPAAVCVGSSINLGDVSVGGTWSSSNPAIASITASGVVSGLVGGGVIITYTLATGCIITTPVSVVPLPGAPTTVNLQYCQGDSAVALTATGSNLLWYTSTGSVTGSSTAPIPSTSVPGVTTWYVSQTVNGCEGPRAPLQVTVYTKPVFNIVPARPDACQNDSISFYCVGPTFTGETYSWSLPSNGVLYPGSSLTTSSITMEYTVPLGNNYMVLTVGDGYAPCSVTDSLPMTVYYNNPTAAFYLNPNICVGDSTTIALSNIGPGVTDYTWNFGSATIIAASSNHGGPFIVSWATAGIYTVALTAISNLQCPSKPILDTVDVHALPDATFTYKPKSTSVLCLEDSVLFMANDTAYNDSYLWAPAHGFNNDNKPVIWGKVEETQSDITLTVTDPFGCKATTTQQLDPSACCTVLFPNAFTPNGDGRNDVFRPLFSGYHAFHFFRIANRWGQTIFESENSLPAWDGTFNGVPQDIGTYFYYIQYDCGGNTIEAKGDVTLIR